MVKDRPGGLPDRLVEPLTSTVTQREADTKRHLARSYLPHATPRLSTHPTPRDCGSGEPGPA